VSNSGEGFYTCGAKKSFSRQSEGFRDGFLRRCVQGIVELFINNLDDCKEKVLLNCGETLWDKAGEKVQGIIQEKRKRGVKECLLLFCCF